MKRAINKKKRKRYNSDSDDSDSSWDDGSSSTRNVCSRHKCNKQTLVNYPSPIKTTPRANKTFSDSNHSHLNPAEDLGNLPAEHTQSEITAELSDPELSGDLFNSVNSPLTGKEGRVTAVVAKARCIATENPARKNFEQ
jgi:hypothetical protein